MAEYSERVKAVASAILAESARQRAVHQEVRGKIGKDPDLEIFLHDGPDPTNRPPRKTQKPPLGGRGIWLVVASFNFGLSDAQ